MEFVLTNFFKAVQRDQTVSKEWGGQLSKNDSKTSTSVDSATIYFSVELLAQGQPSPAPGVLFAL